MTALKGSIFRCVAALSATVLMAFLPGCGGESEPAQPTQTRDTAAPPPPTPEEIAKRVITDLELDAPLPARGARLPASVRATMLTQFDQQKATLSKTPEGQAALDIVKQKTESRIDALYNAQLWEHVLAYADAYERLDPNTAKFDEKRAKAQVELRKPRVKVTGLTEVNGHQAAMLTIYVPLTSQTYKETLAVGEEMYGVKFLDIVGQNRGVRLEYLETGERFTALLDSAK